MNITSRSGNPEFLKLIFLNVSKSMHLSVIFSVSLLSLLLLFKIKIGSVLITLLPRLEFCLEFSLELNICLSKISSRSCLLSPMNNLFDLCLDSVLLFSLLYFFIKRLLFEFYLSKIRIFSWKFDRSRVFCYLGGFTCVMVQGTDCQEFQKGSVLLCHSHVVLCLGLRFSWICL